MAPFKDSTQNDTTDPTDDTADPTDDPPPAAPLARLSRPGVLAGPGGIWRVFNALYKEFVPFVRRLLIRRRDIVPASVDELVERVFTTLSQVMKKQKEPIRKPAALIVTITGHEVANHKRIKRLPVQVDVELHTIPGPEQDPEGTAEIHERLRTLDAHFKVMKREDMELILCVDVYELTYAETAQALNLPPSTVAKHYHRARAILDELIRATGESAAASGS
jgi:RNA polymerase sigma factor (sigma-70 family)